MKLFHLYRIEDQSGVSGTGPVVEGVEFTNGWCAIRWLSSMSSLCFYRSLEEVRAVHGHQGRTELVVHDFEPLSRRKPADDQRRFDHMIAIIDLTAELAAHADDPERSPSELAPAFVELRRLVDAFEASLIGRSSKANPAA